MRQRAVRGRVGMIRFFQRNQAKEREELARCYRAAFGTPEGKTVLEDLIRRAGLLDQIAPVDGHAAALDAGRRSLALHIIDQLKWQPGDLLRLAESDATEELGRRLNQENEE